jgi:hypothetical protein
MRGYTRRDLAIIPVTEDYNIVIACDSCGAIGMKKGDAFKLSPFYAAKFTARVVLTEIICSGARPISIANCVANEMNPTGEETITGIHDELRNAGITDISLIGSTEENFNTSMTALAITAVGVAKKSELKFGYAEKGDKLILFGSPRVGPEVDLESTGFYPEIRRLLQMKGVKELVPVGSKGIAYEANTLAALNEMDFKPHNTKVGLYKSAGPATCMVVLCSDFATGKVLQTYPMSAVIGEIE